MEEKQYNFCKSFLEDRGVEDLDENINRHAYEQVLFAIQDAHDTGEKVTLWECDSCGFRFSREHENGDGSGFSCPVCENANSMKILGTYIRKISESKGFMKPGWENTYGVPAMLMLIVTEAAEACEAFRIDDRINFAEEMADIIIRCLHLSARLEIDIDEEIRNKIEKNKTREHKHGGKRI